MGFTILEKSLDEPMIVSCMSKKTSDLWYILRRTPVQYVPNLAWIHCNPSICDNVSEKRDFLQPKITLAELGIQLMFTDLVQHCLKCSSCSSSLRENTRISSMNTTTNLSKYAMNTLFIKYMKYDVALVKPKDITMNSYNPYLDVNVVLLRSILENTLSPLI
jgi:hypothetical protein